MVFVEKPPVVFLETVVSVLVSARCHRQEKRQWFSLKHRTLPWEKMLPGGAWGKRLFMVFVDKPSTVFLKAFGGFRTKNNDGFLKNICQCSCFSPMPYARKKSVVCSEAPNATMGKNAARGRLGQKAVDGFRRETVDGVLKGC